MELAKEYTGASGICPNFTDFKKSFKRWNEDESTFKKVYFINNYEDISKQETYIVPINNPYSRLRNGNNFFSRYCNKLIENIGDNFKEEIEIESNIVFKFKNHN